VDDLGIMQPHLFAAGNLVEFWGGGVGGSRERRAAFSEAVRRGSDDAFPLHFAAEDGLSRGVTAVQVLGFYKMSGEHLDVDR
jgi:hypothetical protein